MSNMWAWDELETEASFPKTPWALDLNMADFPYPRDHHGQWFWESGFDKDPLADAEGKRQAILMATGSEVEIAMAARDILQAEGIGTRVVSMPCWELFEEQDEAYRKRVLPGGPVRVAVEAGIRFGWDRWLYGERGKREKSGFVGMHGFGASAPAETLYEKFGITAEAVAQKVRDLVEGRWQPDPRA